MELRLPAIRGIGGAMIYLVDRYGDVLSIYDIDFDYLPGVDRSPFRSDIDNEALFNFEAIPRPVQCNVAT
jgi:4-hydroxyphenylpyruvate dioxygenase-like putative hemolysin